MKNRNYGTMTESQYWSKIRSLLRRGFMYWKPMSIALEKASRPYKGSNKRQKKEYLCSKCGKWFPRKDVEIDHIEEVGSLKCADDLKLFLEKLTPENPSAFQILCKEDHKQKTKNARERRKK
jgi:DNA-directed RNA polymerase subunit RPC12/RpoP